MMDEKDRKEMSKQTITSTMQREINNWAYVYGPHKAGKTRVANAVADELVWSGREDVRVCTTAAMLEDIRIADAVSAENGQNARRWYEDAEVLILDDIGAEEVSAQNVATVYRILSRRYLAERPTFLASTLSPEKLRNRYASADIDTADSILAIIRECAITVTARARNDG